MLIFGSHVHKAKLTLHTKIRCHRPTFFSKRYLTVFGHGFFFLKASLILIFGAEHVFSKLQAPTPPPPPSQLKRTHSEQKVCPQHSAYSLLYSFFFIFFFLSLPFQPFSFSYLLLTLRTCIPIFVILAQLLQKKSTLRNPNVLFF